MFSFYFYRQLPFQYFWYKNFILQYKFTKPCIQGAWLHSGSGSGATLIINKNISLASIFIAQQRKHFASDSSKRTHSNNINNINTMENKNDKITVNKEELKQRLTPLQYQVTQEAATERPFTGCYNKHYEKGIYQCIVCHQDLFSSDTKYDSGCGWPAFNDVLDKGKITLHRDASIPGGNILLLIKHPERIRTEVRCSRCNAHMGHVFEDGPKPTRKRYCINSASIDFVPAKMPEAVTATTTTTTMPPSSVLTTSAGSIVGASPVAAPANVNIISAIAQQ